MTTTQDKPGRMKWQAPRADGDLGDAFSRLENTVTRLKAGHPNTSLQQLAATETSIRAPQKIRDRQHKSDTLEQLAGLLNQDTGALLMEINRDLLVADGSIPS